MEARLCHKVSHKDEKVAYHGKPFTYSPDQSKQYDQLPLGYFKNGLIQ